MLGPSVCPAYLAKGGGHQNVMSHTRMLGPSVYLAYLAMGAGHQNVGYHTRMLGPSAFPDSLVTKMVVPSVFPDSQIEKSSFETQNELFRTDFKSETLLNIF